MNQIHKLFRWAWSILVVCTLAFAMGGCEGDDGAQGPTGPQGPVGATGPAGADGADGAGAATLPLESCGVCHSEGSFASAPAAHALDPIEFVSSVSIVAVGDDLLVTFDLERDGMLTAGYDTIQRGYRTDGTTRTTIVGDLSALTDNGDGSYSFTIPDGNLVAGDNRYMFRVAAGDDRETRVYFYQDFPASPFAAPAVSAQACTNCHGPEGIGVHGGYFMAEDGGEPCLVCHGVGTVPSLAAVTHGLHSGIWVEDGELIEVTYPTYMTNCSVCHDEPAQLAAANGMLVTGPNCLSCHGSMDNASWDFSGGLAFHLTGIANPDTHDCQTACHIGNGAASTLVDVTDFHNGWETPRGGFIVDGADTSITEGELFDWQITDVVDDGVTLAISWTATYDGAGVDPCNETVGAGAPVFFAGDGDLTMYRSYAQGDDFIIGTSTSSPGQPVGIDLTVDNTTCANGIATTTLPADSIVAEKGRLALGGKPLVVSAVDPAAAMEARVPTPTFDWLVGDGAEAPMRRNVVDTELCLGCHVGSLYQHGGDRVDNVDMCLVCHNSASNEQSVRVGMGVDASEAYDGKVGETFEMKTMLHRIHSAGEEGQPPYLVYRNRGIYAFAPDTSELPNWPGTGQQVVFGSDPAYTTNHNFEAPTYPRSINECTACHTADFMVIPDQAESMATTVEAGSTVWEDQLDDVLQGAGTTACVTCHADAASKGHAYQNSWVPQAFPEGRDTIINAGN